MNTDRIFFIHNKYAYSQLSRPKIKKFNVRDTLYSMYKNIIQIYSVNNIIY